MALTQGKPPRNDWKPPRRTKISQSRRGRGAINLPTGDGDYGSTQKAVMTCGDYGTESHIGTIYTWGPKNKLVNQEYDNICQRNTSIFMGGLHWWCPVAPSSPSCLICRAFTGGWIYRTGFQLGYASQESSGKKWFKPGLLLFQQCIFMILQ